MRKPNAKYQCLMSGVECGLFISMILHSAQNLTVSIIIFDLSFIELTCQLACRCDEWR